MNPNPRRENLIAGGSRSAAQRRENGKRGGVASGAARRMKSTVQQLLAMKTQRGRVANLAQAAFDDLEEVNLTVAQKIAVVMIQKALAGDVRAATWLRDTSGEKPIAEAVIETHGDSDLEAQLKDAEELNDFLYDCMSREQLEALASGDLEALEKLGGLKPSPIGKFGGSKGGGLVDKYGKYFLSERLKD